MPKEDVQKRNANLASEQAAKMVGANRTYVQAATKAAGYDAKTQTFAKLEVLASIGSGEGQTKAVDLIRETKRTEMPCRRSELTVDA